MLQMITDVSHPIGMEATYERTTTNIITTTTNIGVLYYIRITPLIAAHLTKIIN